MAMLLTTAACSGTGTSSKASVASDASSAAQASSAAASSAAAGQTSVDKIKAAGKVIMSTNAEFEPFEYKDGNDYKGIDIEISQKIADKLGVKLEINDIAFDSLILDLQAGKSNFVAAGMTKTEDRAKNVDFSDPYFNASQAIIVLKNSKIAKPADLDGKTIGVQTGTTGDDYCTKNVKAKSVERYNKGMDAVADLIAGRVDAVVIDDYPAQKLVDKNSDKIQKLSESLTTEQYCLAVTKGDAAMLKVVNEVLGDMQKSGDLKKLIDKYSTVLAG
jgi:ABC-type amino acid transport/signal transduction systems, periplasmic component/domain